MQLPNAEQKKFFEQAASQYQNDLSRDTSAQAYLTGRGVSAAAALTFRLGVVRTPLVGHEHLRGRLAIPYLTPGGVVNQRFRCLDNHVCKDEGCPKYLSTEAFEVGLYNVLDFKKDSPVIYICEGEIDTLTLSVCGFPAIGVPGASGWKKHFTNCFMDYAQAFVVADGDTAGRKLGSFLSNEIKSRTIRLPNGEDVNSVYVKGGAAAVQQWLAGATG